MADNWQLKAVLSANAQGMIKALGDVGKMAKNTRKYLSDITGAAGNLAGRLGLPSALASGLLAGFSASAIKNAMVSLADMEDEVSKFTATTGIAGSEFTRFQYLAKLSNVPFEALAGSMGKANKGIYDAAKGKNKELAALYSHLGIPLRNANGQMRSMADMLPELADAFQRNQNPVVRARMGMAMFGKSWQEIMPMLSDGSAKINERMARFKELGLEVKDVAAFDRQMESAGKFGDRLDDLSFVAKDFQNTIAAGLLPIITPLIDGLTRWVVVNKDLVASEVKVFVADLAKSLRDTDWNAVIEGARGFTRGLGSAVDMVGGARNALIALVIVMNAQTIVALAGLIGSLGRAGFAFLAMGAQAYLAGNASVLSMLRIAAIAIATAGPIGAVGAAFAWLTGIAAGAGGIISGAMGMVGLAIRGVGAALMANPLGIILGLATAAVLIWQNWDALKGWFSSFFDWIGDRFQSLLGWAVDLAKTAASVFGGGGGMDYQQVAGTALPRAGSAPGVMDRPSLAGAQQVRASGQIEVSFKDAPPGMRVEQAKSSGDVPVRTDVGYRSYAMGAP